MKTRPVDLRKLKVQPLAERRSLTRIEDVLVSPDAPVRALSEPAAAALETCAQAMMAARERGAGVMLMYGAHLLRNGAALILERMMARGWLTHLATNGAGSIHDWEYSWLGRSTESVADNVRTGSFGMWDETSRYIHTALMAGGLRGEGYGTALGRFIMEDGATLPEASSLEELIRKEPAHPLAPARVDLLRAMRQHDVPPGAVRVEHRWKQASIIGQAFRHGVPLTVHPGIGYDIISNHPIFNGAVIGRAAAEDFRSCVSSIDTLDGGVVLSVGSAIMAPQVFEKGLSCANNLRLQRQKPIVGGHRIYVVDLQDGGNWDWTRGEPPKTNAAYYLRFCKSFSRMGGAMHYVQADNLTFIHNLFNRLSHL